MRVSSLMAVAILVAGGFAGNLLHRQERVAVDRITSKKIRESTKAYLTPPCTVCIGQSHLVYSISDGVEAVARRKLDGKGRLMEALEARSVEAVEGQARSVEGVHWEDVYTSITAYSTVVSRITHLALMVPRILQGCNL